MSELLTAAPLVFWLGYFAALYIAVRILHNWHI